MILQWLEIENLATFKEMFDEYNKTMYLMIE